MLKFWRGTFLWPPVGTVVFICLMSACGIVLYSLVDQTVTVWIVNQSEDAVQVDFEACDFADSCWTKRTEIAAKSSYKMPHSVIRENLTVRAYHRNGHVITEHYVAWPEIKKVTPRVTLTVG